MPLETQHLTLSEGLGGPDTKGPRGNSREERSIWLVSWPSPLPVAMLRGQGRFRLGIRPRPGSPPTQCVRVSQSDYSHGVHPRATLQPCRLCPCQSIPGQGQREACGGRRGTLKSGRYYTVRRPVQWEVRGRRDTCPEMAALVSLFSHRAVL